MTSCWTYKMKPTSLLAAALPILAPIAMAAPAHAAPQPNDITVVCGDTTYTGTAGSPMAVGAHLQRPDGRPATVSVKGAEGYPAFTGVPMRQLTTCDVYINGEFFVVGYVLLTGPGLQ